MFPVDDVQSFTKPGEGVRHLRYSVRAVAYSISFPPRTRRKAPGGTEQGETRAASNKREAVASGSRFGGLGCRRLL